MSGMDETRTYGLPSDYAGARAVSTSQLLGQVMFLVAVGIGFLVLGAYVGRDLSFETARIVSIGGFVMLIAGSFIQALRVGPFAMGYFFATALVIGLGLGPVLAYYAKTDSTSLYQAAGTTALVVAGTGALGFVLSKDLKSWMRPLSFVVLGLVGLSLVMVLTGSGGSPLISLAIGAVSAVLIVVDFNYLRKHGTANDAIWLATGIFVSIVNIFLALLNIFSGD
jgi:FtsH-binding integral membrane protein